MIEAHHDLMVLNFLLVYGRLPVIGHLPTTDHLLVMGRLLSNDLRGVLAMTQMRRADGHRELTSHHSRSHFMNPPLNSIKLFRSVIWDGIYDSMWWQNVTNVLLSVNLVGNSFFTIWSYLFSSYMLSSLTSCLSAILAFTRLDICDLVVGLLAHFLAHFFAVFS